jgi:hypothetical protein
MVGICHGRGAGDPGAGEGMGARARAQAAVGARADDPQDRVFADQVRAVVDAAHAQDGGGGRFGVGQRGGVPGAGEEAAAAEEAGEEGEDQGLDGAEEGGRVARACVRGAVPLEQCGGLVLGGGLPGGGGVDN